MAGMRAVLGQRAADFFFSGLIFFFSTLFLPWSVSPVWLPHPPLSSPADTRAAWL